MYAFIVHFSYDSLYLVPDRGRSMAGIICFMDLQIFHSKKYKRLLPTVEQRAEALCFIVEGLEEKHF